MDDDTARMDATFAPVELWGVARAEPVYQAARMDRPFAVATLQGVQTGEPGDYLVVDSEGRRSVMSAAAFEAEYQLIEPVVLRRQVIRRRESSPRVELPPLPQREPRMLTGEYPPPPDEPANEPRPYAPKRSLTREQAWNHIVDYMRGVEPGAWVSPAQVGMALRPDMLTCVQWADSHLEHLTFGYFGAPRVIERRSDYRGRYYRLLRCEVCQQEHPCGCGAAPQQGGGEA